MRCHLCLNLSWQPLCKTCLSTFLAPSPAFRVLESGLKVYSFYAYSEIAPLLHTKHTYSGAKIFTQLAKHCFTPFLQTAHFPDGLYAIPIDDHTRHDFSHTAILARHLKSQFITPKYNCLKATNIVKYAGKDLEFRQKNPRKFKLTNISNQMTILCDDLITTGATIKQAKKALEKKNNEVLFSLTLADAKL